MSTNLVCGGSFYDNEDYNMHSSDKCFSLNQSGTSLFTMTFEKRSYAASIVYNNTIWITGGFDSDVKPYVSTLKSTEYILKSGESVMGPDLPTKLFAHEMVKINQTHTLIIGGSIESEPDTYTDKTWYFNHENKNFIEGPRLRQARGYFAAGLILDSVTNEEIIVVTGGQGYDNEGYYIDLDSTEILRDGIWEQGKVR